MERIKQIQFYIFLIFSVCGAYKVLVVFPVPSKSHGVLGDAYVKYLLAAGHEVTYITPYPRKSVPPNLHQIDVSNNSLPDMFSLTAILNKEINMNDPVNITRFMYDLTKMTLSNENVQNLLNDPNQKFDVAILEWLFSDVYCGFAAVFECPYIWSSSMDPHSFILNLVDETVNPAYGPGFMSLNMAPFSFQERVQELIGHIMGNIFKFNFAKQEEKDYQKIFGPIVTRKGRTLPLYEEMKYNGSLVLSNSHPSIGQALRLPQNYKHIAGYHVENDVKPLPKDIKELLDDSANGFIYFSMGSILKSKDFPDILIKKLIKMFEEIKITVLWKYEVTLKELPKNVHLVKWAPQQSILSHRNCILFITHGGLLSTIEAIHFGVPIIGIPSYADQFVNVNKAIRKGFAKKVDLSYSMVEDLRTAIEDIMSNPSYAEKAKELSLIYHDRPVSPSKELVHWVEHVVQTRGGLHLRSPALMVPWYQKMYIDLVALLLIVLFLTILFLKYSLKKVTYHKKID